MDFEPSYESYVDVVRAHAALYGPHDPKEREALSRSARQCFAHEHKPGEPVGRDVAANCGGCALRLTPPNYAGWERLYVQTMRPISARALTMALMGENRRYAKALAKDIATWSWRRA